MGINVPRVVAGGLVAGLVLNLGEVAVNVWLLGDAWTAVLSQLGLRLGWTAMAMWGLGSFIVGIVGVWIYAAIRPRYGPGGMTALRAAVALWAATYLYAMVGLVGAVSLPAWLLFAGLGWGLVEMALAIYLGAWLYREGELASGS